MPGALRLQDVTRSGHVLLTQDDRRSAIRWLVAGESRESDFSWLGYSLLSDLSADGKTIVFTEMGEPAGPNYAVCLVKSGSQPLRLGEGGGGSLSPDGRWVTSRLPKAGSPIVLLPTGPGEPREIRQGFGVDLWITSAWLPDSKRLVFYGLEGASRLGRLFVADAGGGKPRPISPEGVTNPFTISGDGRFVAAQGPDRKVELYPVDGGEPRAVAGGVEGDTPVQWSSDGRSLYVRAELSGYPAPARIFRLNLDTGERLLWKELFPEDPAGLMQVGDVVRLTPDGSAYAYRYRRVLADLYLVDGLR